MKRIRSILCSLIDDEPPAKKVDSVTPFQRFVRNGGNKDMLPLILNYLNDSDMLAGLKHTKFPHQMDPNFIYHVRSRVDCNYMIRTNNNDPNLVIQRIKYDMRCFIPDSVIDIEIDHLYPCRLPPNLKVYIAPNIHFVPLGLSLSLVKLVANCHPAGVFPNLTSMSVSTYNPTDEDRYPALVELMCSYLTAKIPSTVRNLTMVCTTLSNDLVPIDQELDYLMCDITQPLSCLPHGIKSLSLCCMSDDNTMIEFDRFVACTELVLGGFSDPFIKNAPLLKSLALINCHWQGVLTLPASVERFRIAGPATNRIELHANIKHLIIDLLGEMNMKQMIHIETLELTHWNEFFIVDQLPPSIHTVIFKGITYTRESFDKLTIFLDEIKQADNFLQENGGYESDW